MDEKTLIHLAELARLAIPEEEKERLLHDIEHIVGFVQTVQDRSITSGESSEIDRVNIFRNDEVKPLHTEHDLVEVAPLHRDHFVEVPKVIE
jgi:aspartyl-tRNA(Asn)/glutamyl-tRNA(Gln) amidotransferase subunit C